MRPLVTVLTLSYNSPDIMAAVRSVASQTYGNIQYIIADDCSREFPEDEIRQILAQSGIKELVIIRNPTNLGASALSNRALKNALGDYIINLAGDDVFYDNMVVEDIVRAFAETGAQYITGRRAVYDERLEKLSCVLPRSREIRWIRTLSPERLFEKLEGCNFIFGCCTARSADTRQPYGWYAEEYRNIDDYPMIMRALRSGAKLCFCDRLFVKYRSGGVSSAANIGIDYTEEADRLFTNEILPYSDNKARAQKAYAKWKKRSEYRRIYQRKKLSAHGAGRFWLDLKYAVSYPSELLDAAENRISRRLINGRRSYLHGSKNA